MTNAIVEVPTDATFVACADLNAANRVKGFLGMTGEIVPSMPADPVAYVKSLTDAELFSAGEKALRDIADDIIVLDEIRNRFRAAGRSILGYQSWKDFVEKNSIYSIRTIQRRLNEATGTKDETKINDRYKAPAIEVPHTVSETVGAPAETADAAARQAWAALSPEGQAKWGIRNPDGTWDVKPYSHYRLENWEKRKNRDVRVDVPADKPVAAILTKSAQEDLQKRYSEKDSYERIGRAIHTLYKHNQLDERLHELKKIRKSDWCPVAEAGFSQVLQNLEEVHKQTGEYINGLRQILKKLQ